MKPSKTSIEDNLYLRCGASLHQLQVQGGARRLEAVGPAGRREGRQHGPGGGRGGGRALPRGGLQQPAVRDGSLDS